MSKEISRRDFLKSLNTLGAGAAPLFLGTSASAFSDNMTIAYGMCGAGMNCSGGGGMCGAGMSCGGSGDNSGDWNDGNHGTRGGSGLGMCGAGMSCSGS